MIVRRFILWSRTAHPGQRAEAASALARAYLYSDLTPDEAWQAETALTTLLDDTSPLVRLALSEAFARAMDAPRHLVLALANDGPDIALPVLRHSPVLACADLVDLAALGCGRVQAAIAERPHVPVEVSAALAEVASLDALVALARNEGAEIAPGSLARLIERHGGDGVLREALLARDDLPVEIRQSLASALARALQTFVVARGRLTAERGGRVVREAGERTIVALTDRAEGGEVRRLVAHLRRTGQLTPALILRSLLSGGTGIAEAAFADLSGLAPSRVAAILRDRRGGAFAALYGRAGLPDGLRPAFTAALSARHEAGAEEWTLPGARLSRRMIERVLTACADLPAEETGKLMALLRRYEVEAAREEAREVAQALADEAVLDGLSQAMADTFGQRLLRAA